jgi:hypothetical protein
MMLIWEDERHGVEGKGREVVARIRETAEP